VVSSSGTDFFSAIAAAVGALKGPRHGGANKKVMEMMSGLEKSVSDWKDDDEIRAYLQKIVNREAGDGSGLIYGMGHAIYTISDPRAVILKTQARRLAEEKGMLDELNLFASVERLAPEVLTQIRGEEKITSANVDLYSGLIYKMMGIPPELYTPLFAIARMAGWCSHRIEEVFNSNKIIRPAYKALSPQHPFIPLAERT
jgi:citrate synthase